MTIPGLLGPPIDRGGFSLPLPSSQVTPPGSNTQVIFNDGGAFGADSGFVYDKATDKATLAGIIQTGAGTIAAPGLSVGTAGNGWAESSANVLTAGTSGSSSGRMTITSTSARISNAMNFGISSAGTSTTTADIAFGRPSAGLAEINSSATGTRRDLVARNLAADAGVQSGGAAAAIATAGAVTYTAAQLLGGGGIIRTNNVAVSDTLPTAAQIVAAMPGAVVGSGCDVTITNNNSGLLTILAGAGVTLAGNTTIATISMRRYRVTVTNIGGGTEAVTFTGWETSLV